jgi:hypothetical protein
MDLMSVQRSLEEASNLPFIGLSLSQTLYKCVYESIMLPSMRYIDWVTEINKLCKQFRISEQAVCHVKLHSFSSCGKFNELKAFSRERRPSIGFKPFANACIE